MQLHNDAQHLANAVSELAKSYPSWTAAEGIVARLNALAEHAFEAQLIGQRESMMEALDEAGDFKDIGSDNGFRLCERAMSGLVHNIDSLSRVLKVSAMTQFQCRRADNPERSCCPPQRTSASWDTCWMNLFSG
jgi:hypothetical protein